MSENKMHKILQPQGWKKASGYANGIIASGTTIFTGGQIGWNADQQFESDDFVEQLEQTLLNIVAVLAEANAGPEHLVRLTWFVTDKREYKSRLADIGRVYRNVLGKNFPAMSVIEVSSLMEDQAKVEIEATAVLPN